MDNLSYIGLGSNLNSPYRQLKIAIDNLKKIPFTTIVNISSFYFNKAIGRKIQPNFYNAVVALQTIIGPRKLLFYCQIIELKQKRKRNIKWQSRTIDIDILFFKSLKIKEKTLTIPHPRIHIRSFVIKPLLEIAPHFKNYFLSK
ncbi:2-amino-4-hydroxy-6-hydroxymethyldihydropteridine diphosphokinase [Candidatus Legionella polyplacis]|uniref:2-amino-4-hydroxy-6-hydroxymethyldihydropteridine pyrophosphokinase n=1 Tax=Candidatus Legionella polyplacis TaxID=2005262 RepID=A0ABZ2H1K2_9GAMM